MASLASGVSIQPAPPTVYEKIAEEKEQNEKVLQEPIVKSLRRKGSLESVSSVMTESSAHVQRQKMTEAVKRCGSYGKELPDIVDMLLTLKRKERSICLFNPDFLKDKINAALEALEICDDDEEEEVIIEKKEKIELKHRYEETWHDYYLCQSLIPINRAYVPPVAAAAAPLRKKSVSPPLTTINDTVIIPPRKSKAIPIVAPPPAAPVVVESPKTAEIKAMLNSFDGKAIHEKKQLLGDQLFPLVKATGVKGAPKLTIRLLDTIELEELAKIMFDKDALKAEVDKAFAGL